LELLEDNMATITPVYGTKVTMTIGLATTPLASDTNLLAGRQSTAVDNKDTDDAIDCLVGGLVTTGATPTASRLIGVFAYGSYDDTSFPGDLTGSDGDITVLSLSLLQLLTWIPTTNTANEGYTWGPYSVAQAFGGILPVRWGIFIVHNTGVALNGTAGNHEVEYFPVKFETA